MPTLVAVAPVGMGTHSCDRVAQCPQPRFSSGYQSPFTGCQCHPAPPIPKSSQMGCTVPPPLGHPATHRQQAGKAAGTGLGLGSSVGCSGGGRGARGVMGGDHDGGDA